MSTTRPYDRATLVELTVSVLRKLADLPRPVRRGIAVAIDLMLCLVAIWLAFSLRVGQWQLVSLPIGLVAAVALPGWLASAWWFEIYRSIIRSTGNRTMIQLATACLLLAAPLTVIFFFVGVAQVPRTIAILQPLVLLVLLVISRLVIRYIVIDILGRGADRQRVIIYGAGSAGQQLGQALRHEAHLTLVGYVDDDPRLFDQRVDGVRVHPTADIASLIDELEADEILLAIPGANRATRAKIVEGLQGIGVRVRSLPSLGSIIDGKVSVSDLRDIQIEELLGRDSVEPDEALLRDTISGKVVLVTGAGGSIGSELCRQILARNPRRLVLVEHSEYALYRLDMELRAAGARGVDLVVELGDVADLGTAHRLLRRWRPDTVLHAAAYKHVPLVEVNPLAGLRNNVLGTLHCCLAAEDAGVGRFILVSTDKAVRPTNVMGASKRICELVLQARAAAGAKTIFSMVRFGNVLGSSGSVVPKFREQIRRGGPVTLTHRNVTRYFMTIPEAAQLVLQAGSMASGGEVFVLDMREPIKIIDLARTIIQLSGLTVRDAHNPDGDIEIEEIGLRPGEKMYEELLIGESPEPTQHASIMRAREGFIAWQDLQKTLEDLQRSFEIGDVDDALRMMREVVPEYSSPLMCELPGATIDDGHESSDQRQSPPSPPAFSATAAGE